MLASFEAPLSAQDSDGSPRADAPVGSAVRATARISVDGRLDEADWASAPVIDRFTQLDPQEGQPASERTEVRILFDREAIYVGARMDDRGPVTTRLARRDAFLTDSDMFAVAFDSYHDHLTAFRFSVNPSGVRGDEVISGGGSGGRGGGGRGGRGGGTGGDRTWDPVWSAASEITDSGWVAEIRIPFSQLRFSSADVQTWGLQLERTIARNQEQALFAFTPKNERGGVARYGHLTGLQGIRATKRLEVLPYLSGRADYHAVPQSALVDFPNPYRSGSEWAGGAGGDLKYRVTSNFTLDATLNPDFGQVELDPAEVNLTAFETRFEEKRPFFIEGADIFRFGSSGGGGGGGMGGGPPQLLYPRRIGRSPQIRVPSGAVYSDMPEATSILGAAKLTGRTASGWSIGLLEAVTQRETAPFIGADGARGRQAVEPLSNYLAGRVRRDLNAGMTTIGTLVTAVTRRLDDPVMEARLRDAAYAGGVDLRHDWANRAWSLTGYVSQSYIGGSPGAMSLAQRSSARYFQRPDATHLEYDSTSTSLSGYTASLDVGRRAGALTGSVGLRAVSPGYEVNDIGFQTSADRVELDTNFAYEQTRPGPIFRSWRVSTGPDLSWNYGGDLVQTRVGTFLNGQWANYWSSGLALFRSGGTLNDRLTRGGPLTHDPVTYSMFGNVSSDPRRRYTAFSSFSRGWDDAGGSRTSLNLNLGLKPADNWDVRVGPELSFNRLPAQYVTTVTDATADHTFGRRYVFADLKQATLGIETRLNVTFTPALSLELYAQPFFSSGDFGALKELRAPRTFDFDRYGVEIGTATRDPDGRFTIDPDGAGPARTFRMADRDFNIRSLRGNAVLRWEWRPGSTMFLVWQQNRFERLDSNSGTPLERVGRMDIARDARELFGVRPDNVLLFKISYWLNP